MEAMVVHALTGHARTATQRQLLGIVIAHARRRVARCSVRVGGGGVISRANLCTRQMWVDAIDSRRRIAVGGSALCRRYLQGLTLHLVVVVVAVRGRLDD